jgi:hypothetical protein
LVACTSCFAPSGRAAGSARSSSSPRRIKRN